MAVCDTDIDDQNEIDYFDSVDLLSQTNNENDVALVPAEQQLGVQRDRPLQQTDSDVIWLPAEGHLEVI